MKAYGAQARRLLILWLLDLLERPQDSWNRSQTAFLDSLFRGQEGSKALAQLAVTSARIRASGLKPEQMGRLRPVHQAIEEFWNNPSARTYENLRKIGHFLDSDA